MRRSKNAENLRGQTLLFRCLETGFVPTAPALGRAQRGRGMDPSRRELAGQRSADQSVPKGGENALMHNPIWMLVPWAVFAVAAGVKFWRLTSVFRRRVQGTPSGTERARQSLERSWQKDQQSA